MAQTKLIHGNLGKDTDTFTHEERVANGVKGGIASGKARRERKKLKETLNYLLNAPLKKGIKKTEVNKIKSIDSAKGENLDAQTIMMLSILKKAMNGDVVAATFIRDTLGENPFIVAEKEKLENQQTNDENEQISTASDILLKMKKGNVEEDADGKQNNS